jgi:2,4-dienoyl-CoA reductase-like NADH-dependent reductase (Old Yellow Enzyme family)
MQMANLSGLYISACKVHRKMFAFAIVKGAVFMSILFQSLALGQLRLENRIIIAPMCQYSAIDGNAQDWHTIHLGSLVLSGAGLLILEATAVSPEGRISPTDLGLYSNDNEQALKRVLDAVRKYSDMPLAIQLSHAGRKGSSHAPWDGGAQIAPNAPTGWKTVAPSSAPHAEGDDAPRALDKTGLSKVKNDFVLAAQRAETMTVWVRISATDWVPGGWDIDGALALSKALKERGCAAIHVSSGGVSPKQEIKLAPGYQVSFAERLKTEIGLPIIAVGLITEAAQAEDILQKGQADAVALARGILYNPRWPWHAAAQLGAQVNVPKQYWRCQPSEFRNLFKDMKIGQR